MVFVGSGISRGKKDLKADEGQGRTKLDVSLLCLRECEGVSIKDLLEEEVNQKYYTQGSGPLCPLAWRQHCSATGESPLP